MLRASEKDVPVPLKSFLNRDFFYFSGKSEKSLIHIHNAKLTSGYL